MANWAITSRTRIAATQQCALYSSAMVPIDQAMRLLSEQPDPYSQQSIGYIQDLLDSWDTAQTQIESVGLDDGIIKLDVIEYSDRAGSKTANPIRLRDEIATRIANALGLATTQPSSKGRRVRS
jgi:hypothetical protein